MKKDNEITVVDINGFLSFTGIKIYSLKDRPKNAVLYKYILCNKNDLTEYTHIYRTNSRWYIFTKQTQN